MTNIRAVDMLFLDDLFEMGGGYVLNFSDRTFAQFFAEELNLDIDNPAYAVNGRSKGKRLRHFLQTVDKPTVVRTLNGLWEYREALRRRSGSADQIEDAHGQLLALINRIEGRSGATSPTGAVPIPAFDRPKIAKIKTNLIGIPRWPPKHGATHSRPFSRIFSTLTGSLPRNPSACAASRSTEASSSATKPTWLRLSGKANLWAWPSSTPSTARSSRRRPGPVACSSATADSPTRGWQHLAEGSASSAWTATTSTRR
jgi:hypothetical protein